MDENRTITVDPDTADAIQAVARKTGLSEKDVVTKLLKLQIQEKPPDPVQQRLGRMREVFGGNDEGGKKSILDKFVDMESIKALQKGNKDEDDEPLLDKKTLKMMLQMQMLQQLFPSQQQQPQQQQGFGFKEFLELQALTSKPGGSDQFDKFMEYQKHQDELRRRDDEKRQDQMTNMMREAITGKRIDEIEQKFEATEEKSKVDQREIQAETLNQMRDMENRLLMANARGGGLSDELQQYAHFRKAMTDFAASEGLKKDDITDPSGKIKWENILKEGIDAFRTVGEAYAKQQPPQQPVVEMTPEEYEAYQQQAVVAQGEGVPPDMPAEAPPEVPAEQPVVEQPMEPVQDVPQEIKFSPAGTPVETPKKKTTKKKKK